MSMDLCTEAPWTRTVRQLHKTLFARLILLSIIRKRARYSAEESTSALLAPALTAPVFTDTSLFDLQTTPDLLTSTLPMGDYVGVEQPFAFHPSLAFWDSEPTFANMPELDAGMGFDFGKGAGLLEDSSSLMASFASINNSYTFPPVATESPSSSNSILSFEPREGTASGSHPQPTLKSGFSSLEDVAPRSVVCHFAC